MWYWQPTEAKERAARKARGEKVEVSLGVAGSTEARRKWAELSGAIERKGEEGLVAELLRLWERLGIEKQANGAPRAQSTQGLYRKTLPALEARFGRCRYARSAHEAARGFALGTADVQDWIDASATPGMAKRLFAVLDNVFAFAKRKGKTTYNPCDDVVLPMGGVREREPLPWEVEVLRTLAAERMGLMMDFEAITGWRIGDILRLTRAQGFPDGVRLRQQKRGKRALWEWTDELRRIWKEAESLPYATKFPASPVFPSNRRGHVSYKRFDAEWQSLKRQANALLAECEIPLVIEDLHFHDLRSKAHDDAEEMGIDGAGFLGNTRAVARRHYQRRERKSRPLR